MKRILYSYSSPIGDFWITPEAGGRVLLGLGKNRLRRFSSAREAAFAVYEQKSGAVEWDEAEIPLRPKSLQQWSKGT